MAANIEFSNSVPYIKVSIFNTFKFIFEQFHPVLTALKVIYTILRCAALKTGQFVSIAYYCAKMDY